MTDQVPRALVVALGMMALAGCAGQEAPRMQLTETGADAAAGETENTRKIAAVREALLALGPTVDPGEAAQAARVAVQAPLDRARDWRVVDPPLVHNFKVVNGLREKGVCQDFADAMDAALRAEGFRTLQIHRALANADNLLLEHATVILTARGQPMQDGVILDPWRIGQGQLWFGRVDEDPKYEWETLEAVRARRQQRRDGA